MAKKVLLGMSGGVDSSVAALLLKQQGYDVTGVTLKLRENEDETARSGSCCSLEDIDDARRVCYALGIPHVVFNFTEIFRKTVMDYFAEAYFRGETPNPCIACNRHVKFYAMLKRGLELGFDYIATGHYAQITTVENGRLALRRTSAQKDQSYVLYNMTQFQLAHTLFPCGKYQKPEIRAMAEEANLPVAKKPDSQDICFIPDGNYAKFLQDYTGRASTKGNFLNLQGEVIGEHLGIDRYTIGQRKGLGMAFGQPMYVVAIHPESNTITLGPEGSQYRTSFLAKDCNFMALPLLTAPTKAMVQTRYQAPLTEGLLTPLSEDTVLVELETPQRSVTPGQAVVFYQEDVVLGGGTIALEPIANR